MYPFCTNMQKNTDEKQLSTPACHHCFQIATGYLQGALRAAFSNNYTLEDPKPQLCGRKAKPQQNVLVFQKLQCHVDGARKHTFKRGVMERVRPGQYSTVEKRQKCFNLKVTSWMYSEEQGPARRKRYRRKKSRRNSDDTWLYSFDGCANKCVRKVRCCRELYLAISLVHFQL